MNLGCVLDVVSVPSDEGLDVKIQFNPLHEVRMAFFTAFLATLL